MSRKNSGVKKVQKRKFKRAPRQKTEPCFRPKKGGRILCLCCHAEVSQGETSEHRKNCPTFRGRASVSLAEVSV